MTHEECLTLMRNMLENPCPREVFEKVNGITDYAPAAEGEGLEIAEILPRCHRGEGIAVGYRNGVVLLACRLCRRPMFAFRISGEHTVDMIPPDPLSLATREGRRTYSRPVAAIMERLARGNNSPLTQQERQAIAIFGVVSHETGSRAVIEHLANPWIGRQVDWAKECLRLLDAWVGQVRAGAS